MTVSDYFRDALGLIGVLAEGETPSAEQGVLMLRVYNDMMHSLADQGIELGFNVETSTTGTLVLPEGHRQTIKYLLAVQSANYFHVEVPLSVASMEIVSRLNCK